MVCQPVLQFVHSQKVQNFRPPYQIQNIGHPILTVTIEGGLHCTLQLQSGWFVSLCFHSCVLNCSFDKRGTLHATYLSTQCITCSSLQTHTTLQVGLYQCDSTVYSVRNYSLGYPCISVKIRLSTVKSISRKSLLVACCMALTRCVETHFSKSSSSRMCLVATKTMVLMGLLEQYNSPGVL